MNFRPYLPSPQFTLIVVSVALSGLLVIGAQAYTSRHAPPSAVTAAAPLIQADDVAWQAALAQVQGSAGIEAPQGSDPQAVSKVYADAKNSNITASVGRTLLVGLTDAKTQGLGDDVPTQEKIIKAAQSLLPQATTSAYAAADLKVVPQTNAALKAYGNAFIATMIEHPSASVQDTYLAMGYATDYNDAGKLESFPAMAKEYRALARELAALSVPQTLAPLHLQVVNDFLGMADTYADMQTVLKDPLRGVAGLKRYESLSDEATRVLTNIAQALGKSGILFNKDEPGSGWAVFLSS